MKDMSLIDVVTGYRNDGSRILGTDTVTDWKREMADAELCATFGEAIAQMKSRTKLPIGELFDAYNKDREGLLAASKAVDEAEAAKGRDSFWLSFWPPARRAFNENTKQQDAKIEAAVMAVNRKIVTNIFDRNDRQPRLAGL